MPHRIKSIEYLYESKPSRRELKIKLTNRTIIHACSCYESWQQWGGSTEELYATMPTVQAHNDWLHGGERPYLACCDA